METAREKYKWPKQKQEPQKAYQVSQHSEKSAVLSGSGLGNLSKIRHIQTGATHQDAINLYGYVSEGVLGYAF